MATIESALFTVPEACRALTVSRAHLYRMVQRGEINAVHIGRLVRIPRRSVDAYIERLTGQPADRAA